MHRLLTWRRVRRQLLCSLAACAFAASPSLRAQSAGSEPVQAPPRTIADITAVLDQYQPDRAKTEAMRAAVVAEPPANAERQQLIEFYLTRVRARDHLGLSAQTLEDRRKLLELARGEKSESTYASALAIAEQTSGNFLTALKLREEIFNNSTTTPGIRLNSAFQIAGLYSKLGDVAAAKAYLERGDAIFERLRKAAPTHPLLSRFSGSRESGHAYVLVAQGRFAEADAAYRRSLAFWDEGLKKAAEIDRSGASGIPAELGATVRDVVELQMADNLVVLGRLAEAELAVRNVLKRSLTRVGKYAPATALAAVQFANVLNQQGRFREATAMAETAVDIFDRIGVPETSLFRLGARRQLADALAGREDWVRANEQFVALRKAAEADAYNRRFVRGTAESSLAAIKTGDAARALRQMKPRLEEYLKNLGPNHYQTGEIRGIYAMALAATGEQATALSEYREALRVLLAPGAASTETDGLVLRRLRLRHIVDAYMLLLWEIKGTEVEKSAGVNVAAESFRLADAVRSGSVQQALAASAARAAANQPGLGALIRKEQDERQETQALYETLLRLSALPAEQQLPKIMGDMRTRIAEIEKNRAAFYVDIERRFPDYANLIHPRPATPQEAAKALKSGEALVSILSTRERSFVWALNPGGQLFYHSAAIGEAEIAKIAANLRASLDPGSVPLTQMPAFDIEGAYRLYAELLAPAQGVWGSAHTLVTSVSGALAQIPLSILPMEKVPLAKHSRVLFGEFRSVPWLARKVAVVDVPSVTALVRLRALPATKAERRAFAGFGDPQFGHAPVQLASASGASTTRGVLKLRNLAIARVSEQSSAPVPLQLAANAATAPVPAQTGSAGRVSADWTAYNELTPLPDTREEILAIAQALGANKDQDVFLGAGASKTKVLAMDLSRRRVVAFATHGLIPGDLPGLMQPALALAALDDPKDSPLLTLDDVLSLKLDADLVVLSACNTAAGDGEGAEAVSGLGRGFFYAGSRALLVTHWPVETVSARLLTSGLFEIYAKDQNVTRARALNRSMLALMDREVLDSTGRGGFSYAHPLFWAPYALIGDGGR